MDIDNQIKRVGRIIIKNEMVRFAQYHFFKNLKIELCETGTSSGGVEKRDDVPCPVITISKETLGFMNTWKEYLHVSLDVEEFARYHKEVTKKQKKLLRSLTRGKYLFMEYDEFSEDPEIGDYEFTDMDAYLACIFCHEFAHCLQFWNGEPGFNDEGVHGKHNNVWKGYYRILRREMGLVRK